MTALVSGKLREYYKSYILFFCNHSIFSPQGVILGKKRLIFRRKSLPFLGRGSYVRIFDAKKFVEDFSSMSRSSAKKCKLFSKGKQAFLAKDDTKLFGGKVLSMTFFLISPSLRVLQKAGRDE